MKNNTFESARVKLTLWYLGIIMLISVVFSASIYKVVSSQIEGFIHMQNNRLEQFHPQHPLDQGPPLIPTADLVAQEKQLLYSLILLNLIILTISGSGGYFLAGQTLSPIKTMLDDQSQFISNSSHELRTPITILRAEMEASLLEKHLSDPAARALINSNLEELSSLQKLTDSLLQIARLNNGPLSGSVGPVDINLAVKSALKKVSALASQKNISLKNTCSSTLVVGSIDGLTEVLVILLDNAIKYSPKNSQVKLSSEIQKNHLVLSVVDQGIGISVNDLPHIFERFYRADKSRSQAEGFGLGLSIAKKIISALDGNLEVDSHLNQGTTFKIILNKP